MSNNKTHVEKTDQLTILRIKRKRTEEPLDALRNVLLFVF